MSSQINTRHNRSRTGERGGIAEAPRVRGGLKFADRFPAIFGRFRRFLAKMAHKTTPVSGFLFSFLFIVVDFIENDIYIDIVSWRIFEIRGPKSHYRPFLRFFAKMTAKTTSVSGFLFRFEFLVLDFIRIAEAPELKGR